MRLDRKTVRFHDNTFKLLSGSSATYFWLIYSDHCLVLLLYNYFTSNNIDYTIPSSSLGVREICVTKTVTDEHIIIY